jgi:hypothetical protein
MVDFYFLFCGDLDSYFLEGAFLFSTTSGTGFYYTSAIFSTTYCCLLFFFFLFPFYYGWDSFFIGWAGTTGYGFLIFFYGLKSGYYLTYY